MARSRCGLSFSHRNGSLKMVRSTLFCSGARFRTYRGLIIILRQGNGFIARQCRRKHSALLVGLFGICSGDAFGWDQQSLLPLFMDLDPTYCQISSPLHIPLSELDQVALNFTSWPPGSGAVHRRCAGGAHLARSGRRPPRRQADTACGALLADAADTVGGALLADRRTRWAAPSSPTRRTRRAAPSSPTGGHGGRRPPRRQADTAGGALLADTADTAGGALLADMAGAGPQLDFCFWVGLWVLWDDRNGCSGPRAGPRAAVPSRHEIVLAGCYNRRDS